MDKILLVGEEASGKNDLLRALAGTACAPRRALAVEYHGRFVNTPGEFLQNRRFYRALITASADCVVLLFIQSAAGRTCCIPPGFAALFNRRVLGIVTGAATPGEDTARAERFLHNAGVKEILVVDPAAGTGLRALRERLSHGARPENAAVSSLGQP